MSGFHKPLKEAVEKLNLCIELMYLSQVAVKVRHPGVGQAIQRDFALMLRMARLLEYFPAAKTLRLEDSLKQFAAPLREQVRPHKPALLQSAGHVIAPPGAMFLPLLLGLCCVYVGPQVQGAMVLCTNKRR